MTFYSCWPVLSTLLIFLALGKKMKESLKVGNKIVRVKWQPVR